MFTSDFATIYPDLIGFVFPRAPLEFLRVRRDLKLKFLYFVQYNCQNNNAD